MSAFVLYDKQTGKEAVVAHDSVSAADVRAFCMHVGLDFYGMGCPEGTGGTGWDDVTVFRAGTHEFPSRGVTMTLESVSQWKAAIASMGEQVTSGGVYKHYKGGLYTTICEALSESNGAAQVVYRDSAGVMWVRPASEFFGIVKRDGRIVARFAYVGTEPVQ